MHYNCQKLADNLRLLLYQHILLLVAVESQAEVGTSFLENLQKVCLHLRIERELAILCLVETALGNGVYTFRYLALPDGMDLQRRVKPLAQR